MGGTRDARPPGPIFFIFMQFSAKKLQNNRLAHPLWELAPPPKENLGSATESLVAIDSALSSPGPRTFQGNAQNIM